MTEDDIGELGCFIGCVSFLIGGVLGVILGTSIARDDERVMHTRCTTAIAKAHTSTDTAAVATINGCQWYVDEAQGDHRKPGEKP